MYNIVDAIYQMVVRIIFIFIYIFEYVLYIWCTCICIWNKTEWPKLLLVASKTRADENASNLPFPVPAYLGENVANIDYQRETEQ